MPLTNKSWEGRSNSSARKFFVINSHAFPSRLLPDLVNSACCQIPLFQMLGLAKCLLQSSLSSYYQTHFTKTIFESVCTIWLTPAGKKGRECRIANSMVVLCDSLEHKQLLNWCNGGIKKLAFAPCSLALRHSFISCSNRTELLCRIRVVSKPKIGS